MKVFIEMSIDDLLKLQQDLKKIDDFEGKLKETDIDLFKENIELFGDVSADIQCKLDELNEFNEDE